jgi:hypothetical protein
MVRRQIQLPEDEDHRLRRWAGRLGISVAEAVRRCVASSLRVEAEAPSREDRIRAALAVCGRYADPERDPDVAKAHDRHLADAYRR